MSKLLWASLLGLCAFGAANANPHKILHCTHGSPVFMPYGAVPYGAPAYGAPVYGAPVYGAPVYGAPVYGAPVYGAPVYGAPVYGAPVYGAPVYGAPAYGGPLYGADGKLLKTAANVALAYFHLPLLPAGAGGGNQGGGDGGDDDLRGDKKGDKKVVDKSAAPDLTQKKLDLLIQGQIADKQWQLLVLDYMYKLDTNNKLPPRPVLAPPTPQDAYMKSLIDYQKSYEDLKKLNKDQ